ncbi:MAG: hypothetical protein ACOCQQ_01720 [Candidatus Nanoarchaeia archaeon]
MVNEFTYLKNLLPNQEVSMHISKKNQTITYKGDSKYIKPLVQLIWTYSIKSKTTNEEIERIAKLNKTKRFQGMYDTVEFSNRTCVYQLAGSDKSLRKFYFNNYIITITELVLKKYAEKNNEIY